MKECLTFKRKSVLVQPLDFIVIERGNNGFAIKTIEENSEKGTQYKESVEYICEDDYNEASEANHHKKILDSILKKLGLKKDEKGYLSNLRMYSSLLWRILETIGFYNSKHNRYRLEIRIIDTKEEDENGEYKEVEFE